MTHWKPVKMPYSLLPIEAGGWHNSMTAQSHERNMVDFGCRTRKSNILRRDVRCGHSQLFADAAPPAVGCVVVPSIP